MQAAWEKLLSATLTLTRSEPIKHRLIVAFSEHLQEIDPADLPKELRLEFRELIAKLSAATPMRGESAVAATVRKMSNHEIESCARTVVELLARARAVQPMPMDVGSSVVPLYAALPDGVPPLLAVNRA